MNNGSSGSEASSSRSPNGAQQHDDLDRDRDESDTLWQGSNDTDNILGEDPLRDDFNESLSFKRKQKKSLLSQAGGLLSSLTRSRHDAGSSNSGAHYAQDIPEEDDTVLEGITSPRRNGAGLRESSDPKDGVPLDWYVEGPGRRVGYEDLTAIDWIFEYTKERQRLRVLYSSASGLIGYAQRLLDASQVWVILVLSGIAVGVLAAGIDVTTDWLGDLKAGYCSSQDGGAFYLNKAFCCLGYDETSQCSGWRPWSAALGIKSAGGKWFIEYFFFLLFSVCPLDLQGCWLRI